MRIRCGTCGRLQDLALCVECRRVRKRIRNEAAKTAAEVVAEWRAAHGDWCPGWGRPGHESSDLTADHVLALANGGSNDGEWAVRCRSCNSRKGKRPDGTAARLLARQRGWPRR